MEGPVWVGVTVDLCGLTEEPGGVDKLLLWQVFLLRCRATRVPHCTFIGQDTLYCILVEVLQQKSGEVFTLQSSQEEEMLQGLF